VNINNLMDVSGIQLESSLSMIDASEVQEVGGNMADARLSQILKLESDHTISGLLTVT
jgi:hypothetical protein